MDEILVKAQRNVLIDALKGLGILFMIFGHAQLPPVLQQPICLFHMPLFFLISGYLYKNKGLFLTTKHSLRKIIIPYLFTGFVIWIILIIQKGEYDWGISLLFGNAYKTLSWNQSYTVGPLWFLMSFFSAQLLYSIIFKIKHEEKRFLICIVLFEISIILKHFYNMLPLGILPAMSGILFMQIGQSLRTKKHFYICHKKILCLFGVIAYIICLFKGNLAMSWHIYDLNLLLFVSATFVTILCYLLLKRWGGHYYKLNKLGYYSLPLMCIHAVDRKIGITISLTQFITDNNFLLGVFDFVLKIIFVILIFKLIKKIKFFKTIYSIK